MKSLTRLEFHDALQKGQGRAVLHLQEYGIGDFQEEILQACLHDLSYDTQAEGNRADWLISILDIIGNADFYRERILARLVDSEKDCDVLQLLDLAAEFARRGCPAARSAIYVQFNKQQFPDSSLGEKQIVALDGVRGLLHVADVKGARLRSDPEAWESDWLLSEVCERCGLEETLAAIQDRAGKNVNVRAYLDAVMEDRTRRQESTPSRRSHHTVETILADIESMKGEYPGHFTYFGKHADDRDLGLIFAKLLTETRREQLLRCLWVFRRRAIPRLDNRLFDLAASADEQLQGAAIAALAQVQDESIHRLARRLLQDDPETITCEAIALLTRNYMLGDHTIIEQALFVPEDPQTTHSIGFDILDLATVQPHPELSKCLEWVCEYTPCTNCRKSALEGLLKRNGATDSLLGEAIWDCCEDIRTVARNALTARP